MAAYSRLLATPDNIYFYVRQQVDGEVCRAVASLVLSPRLENYLPALTEARLTKGRGWRLMAVKETLEACCTVIKELNLGEDISDIPHSHYNAKARRRDLLALSASLGPVEPTYDGWMAACPNTGHQRATNWDLFIASDTSWLCSPCRAGGEGAASAIALAEWHLECLKLAVEG